MENKTYNVKELTHKLKQGTISPAEQAWLNEWYAGFNDGEVLLSKSKYHTPQQMRDGIFSKIQAQMQVHAQPKRKVITLWQSIAAAVMLLVKFTNGQEVNTRLNFSNDNDNPARDIRPGNQAIIEMMSINQAVYKYFYSLSSSANGDGNNAAQANPLTNIKGGALGYFSVHTVERKMLTAP